MISFCMGNEHMSNALKWMLTENSCYTQLRTQRQDMAFLVMKQTKTHAHGQPRNNGSFNLHIIKFYLCFTFMRDNNVETKQCTRTRTRAGPKGWDNENKAPSIGEMSMQKVCWQLSVKLFKSSHNFVNLGPCTHTKKNSSPSSQEKLKWPNHEINLWKRVCVLAFRKQFRGLIYGWQCVDYSDRHDLAPEVHLLRWDDMMRMWHNWAESSLSQIDF